MLLHFEVVHDRQQFALRGHFPQGCRLLPDAGRMRGTRAVEISWHPWISAGASAASEGAP
jgi:hypothetical protein